MIRTGASGSCDSSSSPASSDANDPLFRIVALAAPAVADESCRDNDWTYESWRLYRVSRISSLFASAAASGMRELEECVMVVLSEEEREEER